ncbi:hypothetical protein F5X96DRAFT_664094 [Biscogniauxia mediterranea]|nr:hypothetical protein F5X96DRAFT_664094 [Biscogniauxia mediterranea]
MAGPQPSVSTVSPWSLKNFQTYNTTSLPSRSEHDESGQEQHAQKPPTSSTQRCHFFGIWSWEFFTLGLSFASMSAIIAVLVHFNGQPFPQWPYEITLNTLVALLATILRASMADVICQVISQIKWSWFQRPRPLIHIQEFDQASRGLIGSIRLLFVAPTSVVGVIGALVTIISLAIGSFTQQAVKPVGCTQLVPNVQASLPMAHFVPGSYKNDYFRSSSVTFDAATRAGEWDVSPDMQGVIINGLANPSGNDSALVASCQTGNCTFPVHAGGITHSSIAMCSSCIDTTPLLDVGLFLDTNITQCKLRGANVYPVMTGTNGGILSADSEDNLTWASSQFTDAFSAVASQSLLNTTFLAFTSATCTSESGVVKCQHNISTSAGPSDCVATSCALYPCLKNFHAEVRLGTLSERVVSSVPAVPQLADNSSSTATRSNYTSVKTPCLIDGVEYDLTTNSTGIPRTSGRQFLNVDVNGTSLAVPSDCVYRMDWDYSAAMLTALKSHLGASCQFAPYDQSHIICNPFGSESLYNSHQATFETLSTAMDQLTSVITNRFRISGVFTPESGTRETVLGDTVETTVCMQFHLEWLTMPLALLAITTILLISTIVANRTSRGHPLWKSSVLPLLFYGFRSGPSASPEPLVDLDRLRDRTKHVMVKLQDGYDAGFIETDEDRGYTINRDIDVDSLIHRD